MKEFSFRDDILPLKNKLYRLAFRITLDSAEAEDIVQETMIRIWNKRVELQSVDSIEAYCLTVCRNLAIDKHEKKDAQHIELNEALHDSPDLSGPHEQLVLDEQMELVHRLFNQLPEQYRTVMQLRDIEGKSYKEIAVILHLTEEQVKINLFRARQKIRTQFKEIENYGL